MNRNHLVLPWIGALALAAAATSCAPYRPPPEELTSDLPVPAGLEVPEKNRAQPPAAEGEDLYPERLSTAFGEMPDGISSVHARGFVHASLDTLWTVVGELDPLVDRRRVARWSSARDVEPAFSLSADVTMTVEDLATFDYVVAVRGARVAAGQDHVAFGAVLTRLAEPNLYMTSIVDSVVLRTVAPEVTAVELVRHTKTIATGEREAQQYVEDLFASLVERAHGRPLPAW